MVRDAFERLHPVSIALYFLILLITGAFTMHPCFIVLSFIGALCFAVRLSGREIFRHWKLLLIPALIAALINVLFNHRGTVILAYFPTGNALTLEALIYGAASGVMVSAVIVWCFCFGKVFSSDKLICLTGKAFPSLTLVLSMTLRFLPLFITRFREIADSRRQLGKGIRQGSLKQRLKNLASVFSILISRSLESSVETADSMKSRGYGLPHRTAYDLFRFGVKDAAVIALTLLFGGISLAGLFVGFSEFRFYPKIYISEFGIGAAAEIAAFGLLCFLPTFYGIWEDLKWRSSDLKN